MSDKLTAEFNEYNKLMRKLGSKTMTMEQYKKYRSGKLGRYRGKPAIKSPMEAKTYIRPSPKVPSGDTYTSFVATKREMQYTGDKLVGIATMHKSNMVPVFKQEDAEDIARMRR